MTLAAYSQRRHAQRQPCCIRCRGFYNFATGRCEGECWQTCTVLGCEEPLCTLSSVCRLHIPAPPRARCVGPRLEVLAVPEYGEARAEHEAVSLVRW